jgi:hypothetical protein
MSNDICYKVSKPTKQTYLHHGELKKAFYIEILTSKAATDIHSASQREMSRQKESNITKYRDGNTDLEDKRNFFAKNQWLHSVVQILLALRFVLLFFRKDLHLSMV